MLALAVMMPLTSAAHDSQDLQRQRRAALPGCVGWSVFDGDVMGRAVNEDSVPALIKHVIALTGLRRQQLADLIGVTRQAVHDWASGRHQPLPGHYRQLQRLSALAQVVASLSRESPRQGAVRRRGTCDEGLFSILSDGSLGVQEAASRIRQLLEKQPATPRESRHSRLRASGFRPHGDAASYRRHLDTQ